MILLVEIAFKHPLGCIKCYEVISDINHFCAASVVIVNQHMLQLANRRVEVGDFKSLITK
jgi:hypothetical protein